MTILIECETGKDAENILKEVTKQSDTIGFSPEYLQRLGAKYTLYENYKALLATGMKVRRNNLVFDIDVMFDKKMSLVDFLKHNPAIRDIALVKLYFTEDVLNKALEIGAINRKKDKIII